MSPRDVTCATQVPDSGCQLSARMLTGVTTRSVAPTAPAGRLTTVQGTALYLGAVLGTGVIGLPALAARAAGPASLLAWLALVLLSVPLAATFAALGARYPDAGGVSTYVRHAFGARAAAVVGWCFYFAMPAGAPAAALFAGGYVKAAVGGGQTTVLLTAVGLVAVMTAANAFGVTVSGRVQLVLAALLVALLLAAVVAAAPRARLSNLHPFAPHGWLAVGSAAALLVWSFAGWEAITHLAADFRRPHRDLPRATAAALVLIGILYLAVATTSILVLGPAITGTPTSATATAGAAHGAASAGAAAHGVAPGAAAGAGAGADAPLAQLLASGIGGGAKVIAAVAAVVLTLGVMNAYCAGAAKLGAALARDGALPGWFARGSRAGEVPRRSLTLVAGLSALGVAVTAAFHLGTEPLVLLTTGSFVAVYALGTAAAVRLLPRRTWGRRAALLALVAVLALLVATGRYLLWPLLATAGALTYLHLRTRRERKGSGPTSTTSPAGAAEEPSPGCRRRVTLP
jgi:amino acid efflux transporter